MKALFFDFKDAFYQGSVTPENALEQCVRWKHPISGESTIFAMQQKIFGHHLSPQRYIRVHNAMFEFLKKCGFPADIFVDDGLVLSLGDENSCKLMEALLKFLIFKLWAIIKKEKSNLKGVSIMEWLGYEINLEELTLTVPPKHVEKIVKDIKELLSKKRTTPRELAKVKGRIISKRHGIKYASILTSSINVALSNEFSWQFESEEFRKKHERVSWSRRMKVPIEVKEDLTFLLEVMQSDGCTLPIFHYEWDFDLFVDSSETHTGAHSIHGSFFIPIHPLFINSSSTTRELWGIYVALREHGEFIRNKKVRVFSDNLGVATVTNRNASSHTELRFIHKLLVSLAEEMNVTFWVRWKRRNEKGMVIADAL